MRAVKAIGSLEKIGTRKNGLAFFGLWVMIFLLAGCGGGGSGSSAPPEIPANVGSAGGESDGGSETAGTGHSVSPVAVRIFPEDPAVSTGNRQTFKAEVTGLSPDVTWGVQEGTDGGSITADGTYTAPVIPGTYHIIAISQEDPMHVATVEVTVVSAPVVSVAIEPAVVSLSSGKNQRFTAIVSGTSDPSMAWSIQEGEGGGLIQPDGTYTAPAAAGTYHVIVTSQADPSKNAVARVEVATEPVVTPRFAYVANSISNDVTMHTIDPATGALTKIGAIAAGKEPYTVTVDPQGRFVYAGNFGSNNISMYLIDQATGNLTSTGTVQTGIGPYSLTVDPSGRFAYAANENSSTDVWVYQIDQATGVLTFVETVRAGICPISMTIDPLGRFAYVANTCSNDVSTYAIQTDTGRLIYVGQAAAGGGANSVTVDPSGRFAYVSHYNSNDVWAYRIDQTTGTLTKVGSLPAGRQAFSVTTEPSGRYVYVANSASNNIWMYRIDQTTGALASLGSVPGGAGPRSITAEPSGQFVYVANLNSSDVSAYRIHPDTGILTLVGAYPAGTQTRSVKVASRIQ